jgi:hypothetical protein
VQRQQIHHGNRLNFLPEKIGVLLLQIDTSSWCGGKKKYKENVSEVH